MKESYESPLVYAVKASCDQERLKSQSGGMFAVLSSHILSNNGVVYGCVFDDNFKAIHSRAETTNDRDKMRLSKYVQSDLCDIFKGVLNDIKNNRIVMFSGTSCQIAGLYSYLKANHMDYETCNNVLYTVDIVCHGVPSPLIWNDYLNWETSKAHSEIQEVVCRNKIKYGWKAHVTTIKFNSGRIVNSRVFPKIFYGHCALRPSCYNCPYKSILHPSDITIADYWGIDKALPGFKDNKGVSLVLVNTQNGKKIFDKCKHNLLCNETRIEDSMQKPLIEPYDQPANRTLFWNDYRSKSFSYIARKYGNYGFIKNLKWKFKYWLRSIKNDGRC